MVAAIRLLAADGPLKTGGPELSLYAALIGSWEIDATWFGTDGSRREADGEWHFAWVLGGLGVQDVLFEKGAPPDRRGTSLRCYDPALGAWRVTWMAPAGGEFVHLIGRADGDRIVQEGATADGTSRQRWTFSEITNSSFLWRGEASHDDGETWLLEQQMRARRLI